MIYLGLSNKEKATAIERYCEEYNIQKIFVLAPAKFKTAFDGNIEHVEWAEIIQYKFFYRLLQEIGRDTLVVIDECLRTQNRHDLTYNCVRHFLNQTTHKLIFQYLPIIQHAEDFMVLFDFETRSKWKREKISRGLLCEAEISVLEQPIMLKPIAIQTDEATKAYYTKEKERLIRSLGLKDPHTIPRNLYLLSGKAKRAWTESQGASLCANATRHYVGRNNRFKIPTLRTYKELRYPGRYTVFEFCHNILDFVDFLSLSKQTEIDILVSDLRVDAWYFNRYQEWTQNLQNAYSIIRPEKCAASCA